MTACFLLSGSATVELYLKMKAKYPLKKHLVMSNVDNTTHFFFVPNVNLLLLGHVHFG